MANTFAFNDTWISTFPDPEFAYTNDSPWSMNTSEHAIGTAFQVPEDMSLTHGNVICKGLTGTSPFYKLQLWPMSTTASCEPDTSGTVLAETAAFQATYSYPGTLHKVAFASSYSASANQCLCIVAVYASGTIDSSNYAQFLYTKGRQGQIVGLPVPVYKWDPTWRANYSQMYPSMTCTTNKTYDVGGVMSTHGLILNLAGDGDRGAIKWEIPEVTDKGIKYFVKGIKYAGYGPDYGDIFKCAIWNADGSVVIQSSNLDADVGGGTTEGAWGHYLSATDMMFGGVAELESGNTYYLGVERVSGYLQMSGHLFNGESGMFRSWPGGDQFRGSFWDASAGSPAWDDTMGSSYSPGRLMISPILSDIQGSGGGGGSATMVSNIGVMG